MSPIIAIHLAAALIGLVLGATQLIRRKGTPSHRFIGRIWIAALLITAISSFWIKTINPGGFSYIHLLSVWTLVALTLGWLAIRRGNVRRHRGFMIGTYFGLLVAGFFAVAMPGRVLYVFLFG